MRALTLTQPWATLVILGIKRWETRSWYTQYRGRIAIHAAKGWSAGDREFVGRLRRIGIILPPADELPLGAVLGTVRLDGMIRTSPPLVIRLINETEYLLGDYSPGRYAWELGDPQRFAEPIVARGSLGLWEWAQPEVVAA